MTGVAAASDAVPVSRFLFRSQPEAVRRVIVGVMGGLGHLNLDSDTRDSLQLVLAEVLNNTVEHACRQDADKIIELTISLAGDAIRCEVTDEGVEMPDGALPSGELPDPDALPEGGFGFFLIRTLTSDLDYRRSGDRNRITFSVPIRESGRSERSGSPC